MTRRPDLTTARLLYLASWPHGLPVGEPLGMAKGTPPKDHTHDWRKNPGKDGRIYNVCKCGACHVHGGRGSVIKGKPPKK